MLKKLFSHTLIYALAPKIPLVGSIFLLPYLTEELTTFDYGIRGMILVVTEVLLGLKFLGIEDLLVRVYYKSDKYKEIWSQIYGFLQAYLVPYSIIICILLYVFVPFKDFNATLITSFLIFVTTMLSLAPMLGIRLMQLEQKPITISIISVSTGLINLVILYLTICTFKLGFLGWYISMFVSTTLSFIAYFFILNRNEIGPKLSFNYTPIKPYLKDALPFIPNKYGHYLLNSSDKALMALLGVNINDVGLYTAGYGLGNHASQLKNAISFSSAPILFKLISVNPKDANPVKLTQIMAGIFLSITFIAALWAKEITDILMSNPDLKQIYPIVCIIIMAQNYAPLRFYFTNFMLNENRQVIFWKITLLAGIINVLINLIFIPEHGIIIAAISTFISYLFMTYYGYKIRYYKEVRTNKIYIDVWVCIISFLSILVYSLKDIGVYTKINISISLLSITVLAFILLKRSNWYTLGTLSNR